MKNNIDQLLKKDWQQQISKQKSSVSHNCPSELELSDYLEGRLNAQAEQVLLEHLAQCAHCLSLLELGQRAETEAQLEPSAEMLRRAQGIARAQAQPKKTILNYKWQLLAFSAFILSFIFVRYFLQFLVLAVIFSLKWILDTGSTRTLIMIYQAWRKNEKGTVQRIIRDFQDTIEKRR